MCDHIVCMCGLFVCFLLVCILILQCASVKLHATNKQWNNTWISYAYNSRLFSFTVFYQCMCFGQRQKINKLKEQEAWQTVYTSMEMFFSKVAFCALFQYSAHIIRVLCTFQVAVYKKFMPLQIVNCQIVLQMFECSHSQNFADIINRKRAPLRVVDYFVTFNLLWGAFIKYLSCRVNPVLIFGRGPMMSIYSRSTRWEDLGSMLNFGFHGWGLLGR